MSEFAAVRCTVGFSSHSTHTHSHISQIHYSSRWSVRGWWWAQRRRASRSRRHAVTRRGVDWVCCRLCIKTARSRQDIGIPPGFVHIGRSLPVIWARDGLGPYCGRLISLGRSASRLIRLDGPHYLLSTLCM